MLQRVLQRALQCVLRGVAVCRNVLLPGAAESTSTLDTSKRLSGNSESGSVGRLVKFNICIYTYIYIYIHLHIHKHVRVG